MPSRRRDVLGVVREVADHLIHAVHADRREMIAQRAEIALGIGEKPLINMALNDLALDLKACLREIKEVVEPRIEPLLVALEEVAEPRAVDGHDAERSGLLGRAEEPVAALQKLAQVELQAAAHRTDHVGLQFRIDEVLEIRQPVARRHVEEPNRIRRIPVEIGRDVVRRNREREDAPLGVALHHDFDVGAVDHVHLGLKLAVGEGHFLTPDDRTLWLQILRTHPVESEIRKGRLRAPARRHVEVVDELLHALQHFIVGKIVLADEGRKISVE